MGIFCVYPEEAVKWVGDGVIHEKKVENKKVIKEGTVSQFLPSKGSWEIHNCDGTKGELNYHQLCRAKARYDKKNKK